MLKQVKRAFNFWKLNSYSNTFRQQSTYGSVEDFYAGKSVFVTGGTGFLGKVLIEKLLDCKDINKIYVLARSSKNENSQQRIKSMLNVPLFNRLRETRPEVMNKIVAVSGDVTQPGLGINHYDTETVKNEVSVVFHSAASIKFNSTLRDLMISNTIATQRVVDFSSDIKDLRAFVHVSSVYSQSQGEVIEERIYPQIQSIQDILSIQDAYDRNPKKFKYVLQGKVNSYAFTKALAENIIMEKHDTHKLPAIIVRPPAITPMYKSTLPGWVDSWFAGIGLAYAYALGFSHLMYGRPSTVLNMVPVDYVANCMVVAAARSNNINTEVPVYNISSSSSNSIPVLDVLNFILAEANRARFNKLPTGIVMTDSKVLFNLIKLTTEVIPASIVDNWRVVRGKKPWCNKLLKLFDDQREVLMPFTNNTWKIKSTKTQSLASTLSPEECQKFNFDVKDISWEDYAVIIFHGMDKFMAPKNK